MSYVYFVCVLCVKTLSSCLDQLSHEPCPFDNLKCLKINTAHVKRKDLIAPMSTQVRNYFLENSPSATFIMNLPKVFTWLYKLCICHHILDHRSWILAVYLGGKLHWLMVYLMLINWTIKIPVYVKQKTQIESPQKFLFYRKSKSWKVQKICG